MVLGIGCAASHGPADAGPDATVDGANPPSDATPPDAAGDAGVTLASTFLEFCIRHQLLLCRGLVACCSLRERGWVGPCTEEGEIRTNCEALAEDPALRDGTLVWRAEEAERRLAELEAALPGCDAIDRRWDDGRVLRGTLGAGADCTPAAPRLGSVGRFRCGEGLRCELRGSHDEYSGTCTSSLGALGDGCDHDCGPGLFCMYSTHLVPFWGYCEVQDDTAACHSDFACSSMYCGASVCLPPAPADTWCLVGG